MHESEIRDAQQLAEEKENKHTANTQRARYCVNIIQ